MFLDRLLARALGEGPVLTPRRVSRFEGGDSTFEERWEEIVPPSPRHAMDGERAVPEERPPAPRAPSEAESPQPAPSPATADASQPPRLPPELREVRIIEERLASVAPPPAIARAEKPRPPPAPPEPETPRSQEIPRAEPASQRARAEPVGTRIKQHSVERRFETLVREHTVQRVREIIPSGQPPPRSPAPPPEQASRREPPARQNPAPLAPAPASRRAAISQRATPAPAPAPEPVVHVTIGRVEVRAVQAPASKPTARPREPRMGLDDYLARRERR